MDGKVDLHSSEADKKLQLEFNQWAGPGRGDERANYHSDITEQTLALMDIQPTGRILDLGCGTGWASRRMARLATAGEIVGLDVADEKLRPPDRSSFAFRDLRYGRG